MNFLRAFINIFPPSIFFGVLLFSQLIEAAPPIKLGFVGDITGMTSDVGVNVRDGVLYAVEEINEKGGIQGRKIELIIRDDKGQKEVARQADIELFKKGVVAIIGHITSSMTAVGKTVADSHKILLVTPNAASYELFKKKDFLVCINSSLREETSKLAKVARAELGVADMVCLYDISNPKYTRNYLKWFTTFFERLGGRVTKEIPFESQKMGDFWKTASALNLNGAQGVLLIAAPLHSAILTQKVRKLNKNAEVFCVSWSLTSTFLKEGGKAIEGVWFCSGFDPQCKKTAYLNFSKGYKERYGKEPDLFAILGYETVLVLERALEKADANPQNLLKFIPGSYKGIQSPFVIDEYGDAHREWFLLRVKNGKFVRVKRMTD
ncbi:MAG TPA: amino acid ABC transporter substrate-binding protein [Deltaproteobacteria bacterium]|nr:amino acid ABC transporter substrate-binding protein [Deltaproteobacteria bacterium]